MMHGFHAGSNWFKKLHSYLLHASDRPRLLHRSLVERDGRKAFVTKALHTQEKRDQKCQKKTDTHEFKKKDSST